MITDTQNSTANFEDLINYHSNILEAIKDRNESNAINALKEHMDALCWQGYK